MEKEKFSQIIMDDSEYPTADLDKYQDAEEFYRNFADVLEKHILEGVLQLIIPIKNKNYNETSKVMGRCVNMTPVQKRFNSKGLDYGPSDDVTEYIVKLHKLLYSAARYIARQAEDEKKLVDELFDAEREDLAPLAHSCAETLARKLLFYEIKKTNERDTWLQKPEKKQKM